MKDSRDIQGTTIKRVKQRAYSTYADAYQEDAARRLRSRVVLPQQICFRRYNTYMHLSKCMRAPCLRIFFIHCGHQIQFLLDITLHNQSFGKVDYY